MAGGDGGHSGKGDQRETYKSNVCDIVNQLCKSTGMSSLSLIPLAMMCLQWNNFVLNSGGDELTETIL